MTVKLNPEMKKIVDEKLKSGDFDSVEDVVYAGLQALKFQPLDDFESGELKRLVAEGDESIAKGGTVDLEEAITELRAQRVRVATRNT